MKIVPLLYAFRGLEDRFEIIFWLTGKRYSLIFMWKTIKKSQLSATT